MSRPPTVELLTWIGELRLGSGTPQEPPPAKPRLDILSYLQSIIRAVFGFDQIEYGETLSAQSLYQLLHL